MVSDKEKNIQMCSLKFSLAKCYFPIPGARAFNSYSNEINNLQVKDVTSNYTYNPRSFVYFIKPYNRSRFLHSRKVKTVSGGQAREHWGGKSVMNSR